MDSRSAESFVANHTYERLFMRVFLGVLIKQELEEATSPTYEICNVLLDDPPGWIVS
jgi:hypothetical protein